MAQPIPRLEGIKRIPLFPLPIALFPTAMLPLHIFEERYKAMLRDCMFGEKIFGVTFTNGREGFPPPVGRVGCAAFVLATVPLEEGRMNILTTGISRFRVLEYFEEKSYLEGEVEYFEDEPGFEDLTELAGEVADFFTRTIKSIRVVNRDEGKGDEEDNFPDELPDDPQALSFIVASSLQLSDEMKIQFLEMTSTKTRLEKLRGMLRGVVERYEMRAVVKEKAKTNGHGSHKVLDQLLEKDED